MINQDTLIVELLSLADLQIRLNDKGGPSSDGELFEQVLENQDEILNHFGLPAIPENGKLLWFDKIPSQEELLERITELHNRASTYLLSDTKSELQILRDAQEFGHEAMVVLPELKITTHLYTIFVFNEVLLNNEDTVENVLNELKIANRAENLDALGRLIVEDDEQVLGELFEFLEDNGLLYLDKFIIANFIEDNDED